MTQDQIEMLVARLEVFASRAPQAYKRRVLVLALLGYAYLALVVAGLLAICAGLGFLLISRQLRATVLVGKLAFPLLGLAYLIVRSLWVRFPAPQGLKLASADSPVLFREIDRLRRSLHTPAVHAVLLTQDFNAAVAQTPRLGLLGWQRNYLILGLPLLMALSPEQFLGVLAHEFGHLSGAHGRFGGWIYRVRQSWYQVMTRLEQEQHWGSAVFARFLKWYAPYFGAYSWVMARAQEYEADRCSVAIVGARTTADALVRLQVLGSFLEESFYKQLYSRVENEPEPLAAPCREMREAFRSGIDPSCSSHWLRRRLRAKTGRDDTHPSLRDRLAAIGQQPHFNCGAGSTSAELLFGDALPDFIAKLDSEWKDNVGASWRERHQHVREVRTKLAAIEFSAATQPLTAEQAWERASLTEEIETGEKALPLYEEALSLSPVRAAAQFAVGRLRLRQGQVEGMRLIEQAMEQDSEYRYAGCGLIAGFLQDQGRDEEAKKYLWRAEQEAEVLEAAYRKRSRLSLKESDFVHHGLMNGKVEEIRSQLARFREVAEAYLVCRAPTQVSEQPLFILGIERNLKWYQYQSEYADTNLIQRLCEEIVLPGEGFIVMFSPKTKKIKKGAKAVPKSRIYVRPAC